MVLLLNYKLTVARNSVAVGPTLFSSTPWHVRQSDLNSQALPKRHHFSIIPERH